MVYHKGLISDANTALNVAMISSVTGGVYINAQGFTAP